VIPTDQELEGELRSLYQKVAQSTPPYQGAVPAGDLADGPTSGRRRRGRWIAIAAAASVALLCATVALLASTAPDEPPPADGSDSAAPSVPSVGLLVAPPSDGTLQALVEGRLEVNADGCVTIEGRLLLAPHGSRVTPDGTGVEFSSTGEVEFGSVVQGAGGYVTLSTTDAAAVSDPFGCLKTVSGPIEVTTVLPN
jgi:hypothetical protein